MTGGTVPRVVGVALTAVFVLACAMEERPAARQGSAESVHSDTIASSTVPADSVIQGIGTIRYVDVEGGFYGIVDTSGTKYDPTPLADRFQEDGLRVRFEVTEKDVLTTRMWGTPVEVLHMERVGESDGG